MTTEQARQAIDAGADFLVTPDTPPALADALAQPPISVVPGGATPTEFLALMARGFRACQLFPVYAAGGLAMLKGPGGPSAALTLCQTGRISEADAAGFSSRQTVWSGTSVGAVVDIARCR